MKLSTLWLSCSLIFGGALIPVVVTQGEAASTEVIENCPMPEKPSIPNGLRSTEEEMLAAQKNIKDYIASGESVLDCLEGLRLGWGEAATEEQLQVNNLFYNRMVEEMQATGELFNSAVRAYKGRNE